MQLLKHDTVEEREGSSANSARSSVLDGTCLILAVADSSPGPPEGVLASYRRRAKLPETG